jgi:hypothetical protein
MFVIQVQNTLYTPVILQRHDLTQLLSSYHMITHCGTLLLYNSDQQVLDHYMLATHILQGSAM